MQIVCEKCDARYGLADDKIKPSGTSVRCPKCNHVFKVFPPGADAAGGGGATVACANCGKDTPAVAGQAVVFCDTCRQQIADPQGAPAAPAAGAAADPFAGMADAFGGDSGGLFQDAPAAPAADPFADAAPAPAASGGGLFDDEPAGAAADPFAADAPPAGGGLFDDQAASPASGGGLFDDEPAGQSDGGLFDEPAGGQQADPFADFDSTPATGPATSNAADPFGDFDSQPEDDYGFSEATPTGTTTLDTVSQPQSFADIEEPAAAPAPVREKTAVQFKQREESAKEKLIEFLAERGPVLGLAAGGALVGIVLLLTAALAFLPGTFNARPDSAENPPGFLSRTSFSLQKLMKSSYYGQAMEDSFIASAQREAQTWNGRGFANAEKELNSLLEFDPANERARAELAQLYATWGLVEEDARHAARIDQFLSAPGVSPHAKARAGLMRGKPAEVRALLGQVGDEAPLYEALANLITVPATGETAPSPQAAFAALREFRTGQPRHFLGALLYARALRDAESYPEAVSAYEQAGAIVGGHAKSKLETGRLYYLLGESDKAMEAFNQALADKLGPSSRVQAEAKYYLANILHRRGRGPEAVASIQTALSIDPTNPRYLVQLGDIHFNNGKIIDAHQAYEKAMKSDANFVDAYIGMGTTSERLDKVDDARRNYEKAIALDPVNARANFLFAGLILKEGRKREAEDVLRKLVERDPTNIAAVDKLAHFYMDDKRYKEALALYDVAVVKAPQNPDVYVGQGVVLMAMERLKEAKQAFEKGAAFDPENPAVQFRLGQAAYLEGDDAMAERSLSKALARDPYHSEAHLYYGMTLARQGNHTDAHKEFQRSLDVNVRAAEVYRQRGLLYLKESNAESDANKASILVEKAIKELEQALYYDKDNADYYFDYGIVLDAGSKAGKARDAWLKAKELRPGFKEAMFHLARYYVSFTDYKAAEGTLNEVLAKSPNDARAHLEMGKVYFATNRLDKARSTLLKAIRLNGKLADAYELLGEVYNREGKYNEAVGYFQKALKADPKHGVAYFQLALYYKDRDPAKAKQMFNRAIGTSTLSREKVEEAQLLLKELDYVKR